MIDRDDSTSDTAEASSDETDADEAEGGDGAAARLSAAVEETDVRRVASVTGFVLTVALLLPFVVYAVPGLVGASQSYVVLSGSMEPAIGAGDVIVVESVDPADVEEGDVITYRGESEVRPTTHRVAAVVETDGERAFRTKGDANEDPDRELVQPGDVEGRVPTVGGTLFVLPYVGYVISFAGTQVGFALLFLVPTVLLVGTELRDVVAAADPDSDGDAEGGATDGADDGDETSEASLADTDAPRDDGDGTEGGETDADGAITLQASELLLGLVVLGAFLLYSVWVAYATLEIWAFAVAGSVGTAFLMLGGLYTFGGGTAGDGETDAEETEDEATGEERSEDGETAADVAEGSEDDALDAAALSDVGDLFDDWGASEGWGEEDVESHDEIVFGTDDATEGLEGAGDD